MKEFEIDMMKDYKELYIEMCKAAKPLLKCLIKQPQVGDHYFITALNSIAICVERDDDEFSTFCKCGLVSLDPNDITVEHERNTIHNLSEIYWMPTIDQLLDLSSFSNDYATKKSLLNSYNPDYKIGVQESLLATMVVIQTEYYWSVKHRKFMNANDIGRSIAEERLKYQDFPLNQKE